MTRHLRPVLIALFAAYACAAEAQTRATAADLAGTVVDQSAAPIAGASVTARNTATNIARTVSTDAAGRFVLPALPLGSYEVSAEMAGFAPRTVPDVVLALGARVELTIAMAIGGRQEAVSVSGAAPMIDPVKTEVSTVITQDQIDRLPINGRNFINFTILTPGANTDRTPQQGASGTSSLTFAGQRARSNNITVDGLDNNDAAIGAVRATFSQEAVREFQILTNSYSAEFGKAVGGVVNIVTKSGTNTTAGNVFFFGRDESLNAKEHFEKFSPAGTPIDRAKAPYGQKQYGGTIGGPITKDRTFYFGSFERLDIHANNFVTIDDTTVVTFAGQTYGTPAQILRNAGFPVETGNVPFRVQSSQALGKVDHQLNQANALSIRFNWAKDLNENIEPFGGIVAKSRGAVLHSHDVMFAASETSVRSARTVNELRFQAALRDQVARSLDPNCGGECLTEDQGGPTLEVLGVASVGRQRFTPQPRRAMRYQLVDTLSYYRGSHQLKAGFDFSHIDQSQQRLPLHFGGRYIFAAIPASQAPLLGLPPVDISAIQALALRIPARYVQGYGNSSAPYSYQDLSVFAQDDWRLGSHLTAKLGLRYQAQVWPSVSYTVSGYPSTYTFPADWNNVAPRLGLVWAPTADKRTTVHGAYGIYFDNVISGVVGITEGVNGRDGVRTLIASLPTTIAAWNAPGHRLPEAAAGSFASSVISIDPGFQTPYAHHAAVGVDRELPHQIAFSSDFIYVHALKEPWTIDYNPLVPALGTGRRPNDIGGVPGTSASILQYTSAGETWYRGLTLSATRRFTGGHQFLVSYTVSKADDNSTDFQSEFVPQDSGRGRDPNNLNGLPLGFDPDSEKGPSLQDQRHRFVASGIYILPRAVELSAIFTVASGRPYNILAGSDLNGDGDGGATDRARAVIGDITTSVRRDAGTLPAQSTMDLRISRRFAVRRSNNIDAIVEVFNVFNRTNYTSVNNVFGTGSYPSQPLPTFGQFTQASAPRQMQLAVKYSF